MDMEAGKTLTNEEVIRELLDLLKKNAMKERTTHRMAMWSLVFGSTKEIMQKCVYIITLLEQKFVNTVTIEKDFFSF